MEDPELKAMGIITQALVNLSLEQRRNVLLYVNARYGEQAVPRRLATESESSIAPKPEEHGSLGDLFDAANPQMEADRVLTVIYWLQVVEGAADVEAFPVNKHLKNLGHPVSNITRAIESLIEQTPRLALQTSKSGSSKQARKKYKVTREGIKRVQSMLARNDGGSDGS